MKFTITTVAGAMAGLVAGQLALTNTEYSLTAGSPFQLTWDDASGPVTIYLEGGPSGNLVDLDTVASGVTTSTYPYTPPSSLCANQLYAFKIDDGSSKNYSPQFYISGLSACSASTSSSATATSSTSTSSSTTATCSSSDCVAWPGTTWGSYATSISAPLSNYTTTCLSSATTLSQGNTPTPPHTQPSPSIHNTNNGQRASYSLFSILLVTVASLLCIS
jgi:hypothetical protein